MIAVVEDSVLTTIIKSIQFSRKVNNIGVSFTESEGLYKFFVGGRKSRVRYIQGLLEEAGYQIVSYSQELSRNEHYFHIRKVA